MAFSMFLTRSACRSGAFSQQIMRLATQTALQRSVASCVPATSITLKESKTPILNSVRSFRTSPVCLAEEHPHNHAKLWIIEKGVSALLVPLIPAALMMPNKVFDIMMAILIVAHSHWGLEAVAVDYVRASVFGPLLPKIAIALVYLMSVATLGGLFYITTHDIGIANTIRQFWAVKSENKA